MKDLIAKGTIYLTISSIFFMGSGYIINIWLGRHLGPVDYGIYGIIISLVSVVNLAQTSGLSLAVSKYIASHHEKTESIYKSGFLLQSILSISLALLFFLFSKNIAEIFRDNSLTQYLQISSFFIVFYGLLSILTGYYNGKHFFKKQAFIHIAYSVIKMVAIIVGAIYFHLLGVWYGFALSAALAFLLGIHLPQKVISFPYKKLILFSLPLIGIAVFSNLLQSIDLFFIKRLMHSDAAPGFYTAGQNIARIPFFALSALSVVIFPSISRTVSLNLHDETKSLIQKSLRLVLLLTTPLVLLMSATSKELTDFIYSTRYLPAASSLSILLIAIEFLTIFSLFSNILSGSDKPKTPLIITLFGVLIIGFFCHLLIPHFGLTGAAIATTIGSFFVMTIAAFFVYKQFKTLVSIKTVIKILIPSLIIYFLAKVITLPLLLLPLLYLILFAVYLGLLFLLKEITKDDLMLIKSLLPETIRRKINR